ncbi:putative mynd domain protein [Diplodia seriata]|uniref:MYND-type zinc finger protein samB n=1 Tax=Diplodia seriata TaxID=420778 RepID=A0A0G2EP73_9PEZI|nr:putative mynd domain protein [Diplodia seriata]
MREVNFSIPNSNKASVGITTALYDRRALDCTSTLPLINSLNHLAYLTTSSARIRDILTVDGGVERLVCILKEGRSKDMMDIWKWNLAFQCVVNIGVRGSEAVRTRVVEADMVPVIATVLDNYIRVIDKCREKAEAEYKRSNPRFGMSGRHYDNDGQVEEIVAEDSAAAGSAGEPIVGIQNEINMQDIVDNEEMLDAGATPVGLTAPASEATDAETFNITHRSAIDGSILNPAATQAAGPLGFSPVQPTITVANATPPTGMQANWYPRSVQDRNATAGVLAAMPRDEDVLMSLQLLAYVSKYCNLRSYFQKSHLVPRLRIGKELSLLDGDGSMSVTEEDDECEEEYLLPDDFNIFPLVEKFTVRHHSQDMQYWAGVVMRNLCRKDDSRGGIRQCAYYQCGKWEEYTRQFAKCRRCRRTKYCSKECQKSAWVYHRHWCVAAQQ